MRERPGAYFKRIGAAKPVLRTALIAVEHMLSGYTGFFLHTERCLLRTASGADRRAHTWRAGKPEETHPFPDWSQERPYDGFLCMIFRCIFIFVFRTCAFS